MDELTPGAPQAEDSVKPEPSGELTQGDVHRELALAANQRAAETAGRITTELVSDGSGGFLTPSEAQAELAHRQNHGGHSSNETATKV